MIVAHEEAIPRIEARESMLLAVAVARGQGGMKKEDAERTWRNWERTVTGNRTANKPGFRAVAAMFGIPVVEDKPDV